MHQFGAIEGTIGGQEMLVIRLAGATQSANYFSEASFIRLTISVGDPPLLI